MVGESTLVFDSLFFARLSFGLLLFCFLALAMLPFISFFSLAINLIKERAFYERCAYCLTQLGLFLGVFFGCVFFLATIFYWKSVQSLSPTFTFFFWFLGLLLFSAIFVVFLTFNFWRNLSKNKTLRIVFTLLPGILFFVIVSTLSFLVERAVSGELSVLENETDLRAIIGMFISSGQNGLWIAVTAAHFIEAAAAGGIGLLWLWFRRNRDNFGRDYYAFAANYFGEWSAYGAWVSLINAAILWGYKSELVASRAQMSLVLSLIGLSAVLWTHIAISKTPMRLKISMLCAVLFFVYAGLRLEALFL